MQTIEQSLEVARPVRSVYNQWTQFEDFPRFMEGIKSVRQLDDKRLEWVAQIAGKEKSWQAEIFEQEPDKRIAWRSMSGAMNSGKVDFEPVDANSTRIYLRLNYEPVGLVEETGDALGIVKARVNGDLERFKKFVEAMPFEPEGWRGDIHGRVVHGEGKAADNTLAE